MHKPVLLNEVIANMGIDNDPDGIYIDATFGRGGHSKAILQRLGPKGKLVVIDKDLTAITAAEKLQQQDGRLLIQHGAFSRIKEFGDALDITGKVAGILLDLGASSPQFDEAERGFSFMRKGPLDMRMDQTQKLTAANWLAKAREKEIEDVLKRYGEEKFCRRIAKAIVAKRKETVITTTTQLVEIIEKTVPKYEKNKHPATRTFQALRIVVNNELEDLTACLKNSMLILKPEGRLLVISFHSLEEQIIKKFFRQQIGANLPKRLPVIAKEIPTTLRLIGKVAPSSEEVSANPRARSAKLYIMEKLK